MEMFPKIYNVAATADEPILLEKGSIWCGLSQMLKYGLALMWSCLEKGCPWCGLPFKIMWVAPLMWVAPISAQLSSCRSLQEATPHVKPGMNSSPKNGGDDDRDVWGQHGLLWLQLSIASALILLKGGILSYTGILLKGSNTHITHITSNSEDALR